MRIELNQVSYRRLVQVYLLLFLLSIPLIVWQQLAPRYAAFDREFQELATRHYGRSHYPDWALGAAIVLIVANLAATAGLLWFQRWARRLFWGSVTAVVAIDLVAGLPVRWLNQVGSILELFGTILFAIIVLLSYAPGLGDTWFNKKAEA